MWYMIYSVSCLKYLLKFGLSLCTHTKGENRNLKHNGAPSTELTMSDWRFCVCRCFCLVLAGFFCFISVVVYFVSFICCFARSP